MRAYASDEVFNQNFSSVAANRDSEILTDMQRSPSQQLGFAAQWQRTFAEKHTLTAGIEAHDVEGRSVDMTFNAAGPTADVDAGGRQRTIGYFAQDSFLFAPNWLLAFGGRVDKWLNSDGFMNRFPLPGGPLAPEAFPNRSETAFSPRISLMHSFKHGVTASASVYRAFRAPTLNELYRNFRVGDVVTDANPMLTAELLTGGEAGVSLQEWNGRLTFRGDFFWSEIDNPVEDVTLSSTPTLITDQRENLGATRALGAEFSAELQLPKNMRLTGGYILTDSTVISFAAESRAGWIAGAAGGQKSVQRPMELHRKSLDHGSTNAVHRESVRRRPEFVAAGPRVHRGRGSLKTPGQPCKHFWRGGKPAR